MTMANEPADDTALLEDVFGSDREGRGGKEPAEQTSDQLRDERGRFSGRAETPAPETPPEAQNVEAAQQPKQEAQPQAPEPPPDQNANRHVPLSELMAERKNRQEFERRLMEREAEAKALAQLVQQLQRVPQAQTQQPPPQEQVPDAFTDPQGFIQYEMSKVQQQQREAILDLYEDRVREKFGDQKVDAALQLALQTGADLQLRKMANPWSSLMMWHRDFQARQEIGNDFEAFKKRVSEEAVAKALEGLKQGNVPAAHQQRFPGTLAGATATGTQGATLTDEAAMADVFGSDRRQRRR